MKVKQKIISLVLSLTLAMGLATAPAFASSPDTSYFQNNSAYSWSGASGSHSLANGTKLGDLVVKGINYLSLDLAALNSGLNQIYTLVNTGLGTVSSNSTDIKSYLNTLNSGWWSDGSAPSGMTLSWYYQMLQAVKNGATDNSGIIYHLSNIYSSLRYWNGTDTVNITDLVADLGDYEEDIASNTAISASTLDQLLQVVKKTNGKFFEYYTRRNFPNGNFNDVTISTSETYGAYHSNGDGSYQFGSLSGVSDRLEFLAWLHSDLLNVMGMMQTPNTIYKTEYTNTDNTTTGAISLSLQDSIVLGNRVITKNQADIYNLLKILPVNYAQYFPRYYENYDSVYLRNAPSPQLFRWKSEAGNNVPLLEIANITNTVDYFGLINNNILGVISTLYTAGRSYDTYAYNETNNTVSAISGDANKAFSLMDYTEHIDLSLQKYLGKLQYVIADDKTIAAKQNNAAQTTTALDNFTGSGDASASAADFGIVKDSVNALKQTMAGGASPTQAFSILGGDSDGWSWFSQEVADSMDTTNSTRGLLRGNLPSSTPYLDSYYDSIFSVLSVGGDVE